MSSGNHTAALSETREPDQFVTLMCRLAPGTHFPLLPFGRWKTGCTTSRMVSWFCHRSTAFRRLFCWIKSAGSLPWLIQYGMMTLFNNGKLLAKFHETIYTPIDCARICVSSKRSVSNWISFRRSFCIPQIVMSLTIKLDSWISISIFNKDPGCRDLGRAVSLTWDALLPDFPLAF